MVTSHWPSLMGFILMVGVAWGAPVPPDSDPAARIPLAKLIAELESKDGKARVAATKELFRRDKGVLEGMKEAGARNVARDAVGINTRRLDMVFSLIEGLPGDKRGFTTTSFGIHLEPDTTNEELRAMGKVSGFSFQGSPANTTPSLYVHVDRGLSLTSVLKKVLSEEPKVKSVNLNYVER